MAMPMTTRLFCIGLLSSGLAFLPADPARAASDKPVKVKASKVSSAKGREREKLFSDWMKAADLTKLSDKKRETGEQMVYFEYDEGKDLVRGIFMRGLLFDAWFYNIINGEKEMEAMVNDYRKKNMAPLFVVLEGNFYCLLFVPAEQLGAAAKQVAPLGIEPPVLK